MSDGLNIVRIGGVQNMLGDDATVEDATRWGNIARAAIAERWPDAHAVIVVGGGIDRLTGPDAAAIADFIEDNWPTWAEEATTAPDETKRDNTTDYERRPAEETP